MTEAMTKPQDLRVVVVSDQQAAIGRAVVRQSIDQGALAKVRGLRIAVRGPIFTGGQSVLQPSLTQHDRHCRERLDRRAF